MSKFKTFLMLFYSSVCNGFMGLLFVSTASILFRSIHYNYGISVAITMSLFQLLGAFILCYISRVPLKGDTVAELKTRNPIVTTMRPAHMAMINILIWVCLAMIVSCLWLSMYSDEAASELMHYAKSLNLMDDLEAIYLLPTTQFDDYMSLFQFLKLAAESTSASDPLYTEAVMSRQIALHDIRVRYIVSGISALLYGFLFTIRRLRTNYVVMLKSLKEVE